MKKRKKNIPCSQKVCTSDTTVVRKLLMKNKRKKIYTVLTKLRNMLIFEMLSIAIDKKLYNVVTKKFQTYSYDDKILDKKKEKKIYRGHKKVRTCPNLSEVLNVVQ